MPQQWASDDTTTGARHESSAFWARVRKTEHCWVWTFADGRDSSWYGNWRTSTGEAINAHRMAWILTNGAIPAGLFVLHRCDTPACVNPDHLFRWDAGRQHGRCERQEPRRPAPHGRVLPRLPRAPRSRRKVRCGMTPDRTPEDFRMADRLLAAGFVLFLALLIAGAIVLGER